MSRIFYLLMLVSLAGCHSVPPCPNQQRFGAVCKNGETSPLRDETACTDQGGIQEWLCSDVPLDTRN